MCSVAGRRRTRRHHPIPQNLPGTAGHPSRLGREPLLVPRRLAVADKRGKLGKAPHAPERRRQEASMTLALYVAAAVIMAVGSLYFAWRNRDFRKFLAGAFFVSSGIL